MCAHKLRWEYLKLYNHVNNWLLLNRNSNIEIAWHIKKSDKNKKKNKRLQLPVVSVEIRTIGQMDLA